MVRLVAAEPIAVLLPPNAWLSAPIAIPLLSNAVAACPIAMLDVPCACASGPIATESAPVAAASSNVEFALKYLIPLAGVALSPNNSVLRSYS